MSWIAVIATLAVIAGMNWASDEGPLELASYDAGYAEPDIGSPASFSVGSSGSALASAAFGLEALQPETYNGEIVLDIIDASPLERTVKRRLTSDLQAAEAGRADLQRVLTDVRVSLAVE